MNIDSYKVGSCYPELRGSYGSRLCMTEQSLILVISYDDFSEEECDFFCRADIAITFKHYELASVFLFGFWQYCVDAPFDLFEGRLTWEAWREEKKDVFLEVLLCDYSTGKLHGKRRERLPGTFVESWLALVKHSFEKNASQYKTGRYQAQISEIYDNHTIDEVYEMQSENIVTCTVSRRK